MKKMTKMIAAGLMLVAGFLAATAQAETPDYLSFKAVGGDVTIGMKPYGSPTVPPLETSADPTAAEWTAFTAGTTTIALADGETVYFRRSDATKGTAFNAQNDGWTFTMTGTGLVDAGGVITSLIRQDCVTDNLGQYAYQNLFQGCARLRTAPSLPATALNGYCYKNLFDGCSNLEHVTVGFTSWNATNYTLNWLNGVAPKGYFFCPARLDRAKTRSADEVPSGWYVVPSTAWQVGASGTEVYAFTNAPSHLVLAGEGTVTVLSGVLPEGILGGITTLTVYEGVTNAVDNAFAGLGVSERPIVAAIPSIWQGESPDEGAGLWHGAYVTAPDYLSFTADGGSVTIGMTSVKQSATSPEPSLLLLETATSKVGPWTLLRAGTGDAVVVSDGETIYVRRAGVESVAGVGGISSGWNFTMTGDCKIDAGGNTMTILDRSGASRLDSYAFNKLFMNCVPLRTAPRLPVMELETCCYDSMFCGCTSLKNAPVLPATNTVLACYQFMFSGCSALTDAPELPSVTVVQQAYQGMFSGCTSLTNAPALPATYSGGYRSMFFGCTALTDAPAMPATGELNCMQMFSGCTSLTNVPVLAGFTVGVNSFYEMFSGCKSLKTAPELPSKEVAVQCYFRMFQGCTSLTNAPALPATTLAQRCYSGMFQGCTSLSNAPALPATTLAQDCYSGMFQGCTSLTNAPMLPATTLAQDCYGSMFQGCTSLTSAPALPAMTLAQDCYGGMFSGCKSLMNAPALPAMALADSCYDGMFVSCASLTNAPVLAATTLAPQTSPRRTSRSSRRPSRTTCSRTRTRR